ncbi:MAG: FtsX-like permease family protein [Spirochaetaceae bacterium]|jgi:putative ABC transport system permease protein|nr:FtsX-like permease family protein [Spirochaetaceae bacterium]
MPKTGKKRAGNTFIKTLWREIRSSLGRFFSIFAIVALGSGFLTGLLVTTPDMKYSMDSYFDRTDMMDIVVKGTLGLTEEDAAAIRNLDVVEKLLKAKVRDIMVSASTGEALMARVYGLPLETLLAEGTLNRPVLAAGRMPEAPGECLAEQGGGYFSSLPPGTVITITGGKDDEAQPLCTERLTVTGTVKTPLFISGEREPGMDGNGRIGTALYVSEHCYTMDVYTDIFITLAGARELVAWTAGYDALVERGENVIAALGESRAPEREAELRAEAGRIARERLTEAEAAWRAGKEDAERQFGAAEAELSRGEAELDAARETLRAGRETLAARRNAARAELTANEDALAQGEARLAEARKTLDGAARELEANRARVERTRSSPFAMFFGRSGVARYDEAARQYGEGRARLEEEEARLAGGKRLLAEGKVTAETAFAAAEAELEEGRQTIERSAEAIRAGRRELETRRRSTGAELTEAERDIRAGWEAAQNPPVPEGRWYVLNRNTNVGAVTYGMNIEKIAGLSRIFPLFFMLVAALVALTTMTRMVEEERGQIGTLKALGYRKRVIAAKYLLYSGITGAAGSAAGMLSGFRLLPLIIYRAFGTMYDLPPPVMPFDWPLGLVCGLAVLACTTGATLAASFHSLREKPARLLLPKSPKPGRRVFLEYITFLWRPLKFTWKISVRNLLRYKTHFFMTITGIAGCTALMVAAFGIRDSLVDIARTQFSRIQKYDLRIELKEDALRPGQDRPDGGGDGSALNSFLARHGNAAALASALVSIQDGRSRYSAEALMPENGETIGEFITLANRKSGKKLTVHDDAVIITEKTAELLGVEAGGEITLETAGGKEIRLTVTGVTENYVGLPVYLGKSAWKKTFGTEASFSVLLVKTGITDNAAQDQAIAEVLEDPAAARADFTARTQESWNRLLSSISFVVLVLIAAAGGLGGIVLFNLTNINITERRRELATLRVLGFRRKETAFYIFREISALTVIGAAAGSALGIPLHGFIISVAENPDLMFGRTISPLSFILSALFTLIFSALVDMVMLGKINRINMAESLKSPD